MRPIFITVPALLMMISSSPIAIAADMPRSESVISVRLKSYDKTAPKDLKVEYQNMSGKEVSHLRGTLTFSGKDGKVLFTTGVTEDVGKWPADAKSERQPFMFFNVPPELIKALDDDASDLIIGFKASLLKFTDGTEENFE